MRAVSVYDLLSKDLTDYQLMKVSDKVVKYVDLDVEKLNSHYKDKKNCYLTTIYIPMTEKREDTPSDTWNWRACIGKRSILPMFDDKKMLALKTTEQLVDVTQRNDKDERLYFCQDSERKTGTAGGIFPRNMFTIIRQNIMVLFQECCWPCFGIYEEDEEKQEEPLNGEEMTFEAKCDLVKYIY